jgi:putative transposase
VFTSDDVPDLAANAPVKGRRRQARYPARTRPELTTTAPGQVNTWQITKLRGPAKDSFHDAYVTIDIYSRCIVGAHVHAHECGPLAEEMIKQVSGVHGIPHVVHADRGHLDDFQGGRDPARRPVPLPATRAQ